MQFYFFMTAVINWIVIFFILSFSSFYLIHDIILDLFYLFFILFDFLKN